MPTISHILFPFDFSPQATQVVPVVHAFARRFGARVTLISVLPPVWVAAPIGMGLADSDDVAQRVQELQAHLDAAFTTEFEGVTVERVAKAGDPAFRISEFAEANKVDLIVMPTHGLDAVRSMLVGSVTAKVLHDAHVPVWTAAHLDTQHARELPRTVLCAVDGTPQTATLMQWASAFSGKVGGTLKLLHVVGSVSDWMSLPSEQALQDQVRQEAQGIIEKMRASAGVAAPLRVAVGEVAKTVVEHARQEDADLIIIGRGHMPSPFGRLRTHAYGIIQTAPCPVVSV
jgi:nucleotide-binding universal stress UspA family protein